MHMIIPIPFVEKTILSSIELTWPFSQKSIDQKSRVYFQILNSIPLIYMFILEPEWHIVFIAKVL